MRYEYHYFIKKTKRLISFLETKHISYEDMGEDCVFDLYTDQECLSEFRQKFPWTYLQESIFKTPAPTRQELEAAEWLMVMNIDSKVPLKNDNSMESFDLSCSYKRVIQRDVCYRHFNQTKMLAGKHRIKWKSRHFFAAPEYLNVTAEILFCSERTKKILGTKWKGLAYWPVKKGDSDEFIPDLYQMFFANELPVEAVEGKKNIRCRGCHKNLIYVSGIEKFKLKRQYLQSPFHVYRLNNILTLNRVHNDTTEVLIISQEFYRFCEEHAMNRGMKYYPIDVI